MLNLRLLLISKALFEFEGKVASCATLGNVFAQLLCAFNCESSHSRSYARVLCDTRKTGQALYFTAL